MAFQTKILSCKSLMFCLLFISLCVHSAPQVSTKNLLNFILSTPKIITSNRIEVLENIDAGSSITTFKLSFFNPLADKYTNTYTHNVSGSWDIIAQTYDTLSCTLVYEKNSQTYGLLKFKNDTGQFTIVVKIPLNQIRTTANSKVKIGQNCQLIQVDKIIYRVSNPPTLVKLPLGWSAQFITQSFSYAVSQNKLYRYNKILNQYDLAYTLNPYVNFNIYQKDKRIIVVGSTPSLYYSTVYLINQRIYYFQDEPTGMLLLGYNDYSAFSLTLTITIYVSPQLTKLGFQYVPSNTLTYQADIVAKDIDYVNNKISDLTLEDYHLAQTIAGSFINEIFLSQTCLIARNATGAANNPLAASYEEVYQFINGKIVFFGSRRLTQPKEFNGWILGLVSSPNNNKVAILNVYKNPTGFSIDQTSYINPASSIPASAAAAGPLNLGLIQFALGKK